MKCVFVMLSDDTTYEDRLVLISSLVVVKFVTAVLEMLIVRVADLEVRYE